MRFIGAAQALRRRAARGGQRRSGAQSFARVGTAHVGRGPSRGVPLGLPISRRC